MFTYTMIKIAILITISYVFPLFFKVTRNVKTLLLMWGIITVCQIVSLINGYCFRTIGAEVDALMFHNDAVQMLGSGLYDFRYGDDFYKLVLAIFYFFVGSESIVIGQEISICFFVFSLIVFIKINELMELDDYRNSSIIFFGLLPSMFLYCSITLREPYEIFFFIFSLYCFIKYYRIKTINWLLLSVSSLILLGMFHPGLALFSFFLIVFFVFGIVDFSLKQLIKNMLSKNSHIIVLLGIVLSFIFIIYTLQSESKSTNLVCGIINGDMLKYAKKQRHHLISAIDNNKSRATYGIELNTDSIVSTVQSAGNIFFHYFAAPLPWKVDSIKGAYAVFENLLRLILIGFSFKAFFNSDKKMKKLIGFLLLVYFFISFIWAMGTINYGTAIRHHLVGYWILVLLGVPPLIKRLRHE